MLNDEGVVEVLDLYLSGLTTVEVAQRTGLSQGNISAIVTGRTWLEITEGINRSRYAAKQAERAALTAKVIAGTMTARQLAAELGITRQAAYRLIARHRRAHEARAQRGRSTNPEGR